MRKQVLTFAAAMLIGAPAVAQQNFDDVKITAQELEAGVSVLFGAGGNMAVSHGKDGTILIDDQFAPLTPKIEAAVTELGADPVHYVINTHWHGDHTGGNEHFGKQGAHIFAHENVRVRMGSDQMRGEQVIAASPEAALPVVTFERGVTLHLNGDTIDVLFIGGGHTDGDSIVRWREKNIVHMGDLYFKIPGWPYVDLNSGGDIENMLFSLDSAIAMMDSDTKVIPGHGPMSDRAELIAYRNAIGEAVTRVRALKDSGVTLEEAVAARPLDSFERGEGFINADRFIGFVWNSVD
ncbi:MBL fold metallo-hydrolase [Altererythrobacter sp. MF3-039]|uniref:MBL fold metallo-hydrolase n=1 Tax=Altererythrobacter sp. MF3-039 TaxID=3252901 RepID=UPI00390C5CD7